MHPRSLARTTALLFLFGAAACATPIVLPGVPAYNWYHGCTPTAIGSIFGYWDQNGYSNLFDAMGTDLLLTSNVQDQISGPAHNAKYDSDPDAEGPDPPDTSIADFLHTSEGDRGYGGTYVTDVGPGITGYAAYRGYSFTATEISAYDDNDRFLPAQFDSIWANLVLEINRGRPVLFSVDYSGDGDVDHSVSVLGFDIRADGTRWYGMYTTWSESETVAWEPYHQLTRGSAWGVYDAFLIDPAASAPEPGAGVLAGLALLLFLWRKSQAPLTPAGSSRNSSGLRG